MHDAHFDGFNEPNEYSFVASVDQRTQVGFVKKWEGKFYAIMKGTFDHSCAV